MFRRFGSSIVELYTSFLSPFLCVSPSPINQVSKTKTPSQWRAFIVICRGPWAHGLFIGCAKRQRFCGVGKDSSGASIFHGEGVEKTRYNLVKCCLILFWDRIPSSNFHQTEVTFKKFGQKLPNFAISILGVGRSLFDLSLRRHKSCGYSCRSRDCNGMKYLYMN